MKSSVTKFIGIAVAALIACIATTASATNTPPGGGHDPVTVCHKPGTPAQQTLTFDDDGYEAHIAHGDTLGACEPLPPTECDEGEMLDENGRCVPIPPEECDEGQVRNEAGECVTPTPPPVVPPTTPPTPPKCTPTGAGLDGNVPPNGNTNDNCLPLTPPTTTVVKSPDPVICTPTTVEVVRTVTVPGKTKTVTKVKRVTKWKTRVVIKTRTIVKTKIVYVKIKGIHKNGVEANG